MAQLSILIVDDASFIRDLVKRTLRQHLPNAKVEEAINGKKAQNLLKKSTFDLILCDWEMPELSGIEVLNWLREFEIKLERKKTPFIMVTSRGDKKNVVEAVQSGVNDYIGKPFTAEQLITKVTKALGNKTKVGIKTPVDSEFKDSANNLLGATSSAAVVKTLKPSSNSDSNLLTDNSASSQLVDNHQTKKSKSKTTKILAQTTIRTATQECVVGIRDINLQQVLLEMDAQQIKPQILEQVVIDIQIKDDDSNIARINTYVHLVQVIGNNQSDKILVKLNYVDDDEDKMMMLTKYIANVRH
ncbi:MAG: response regulator [Saccharospirillaceae bacterium]|nr:response regulator [Pseudomonadales bacterium]NRB79466.1 response regulator [Saccharospirillaceae bacterium]